MQGLKYNVDIIICIDATGSMSPVIDNVKNGAIAFHDDLLKKMTEKGKSIDELRIKCIYYRDFYCDSEPFKESSFFSLPKERENFSNFVNGIFAEGGGDEPESGLEALAVAIRSDWSQSGNKRRQVIVFWSDASCHPLEKAKGLTLKDYPKNIPSNFDEITDDWEGNKYVNDSSKRFLLFTPDAYPWTEIANNWENSIHYPSTAGQGLSDIDYSEIIQAIANSI